MAARDIVGIPGDLSEKVCGLMAKPGEDARRPTHIDDFLDFATAYVSRARSVAECTALLAGLHVRAVDLAAKLSKIPQRRRRNVVGSEEARLLLSCELLSDRVREIRRDAVGRALKQVPTDAPCNARLAEGFVDGVVWPLLCRGAVPSICWEPALGDPFRMREMWTDPGVSREALIMHLTASENRGLRTLLELLSSDRGADQRTATADYLQTAWLVKEYGPVRGREPMTVRVLFGSVPDRGWKVGHLLRVMIVPTERAPKRFAQQSLAPAIQAVQKLLEGDPLPELPPGLSWDTAVGDYPGGAEPPPEGFEGPSGSLSLGVALVAAAAGLQHRASFLETGHLTSTGATQSLLKGASSGAAEGLRAKRICAALAGALENQESINMVVGASPDEQALLREKTIMCGCAIRLSSIRDLIEAVGAATDFFDIAEGKGRNRSRPLDAAASEIVGQVAQSVVSERDVKRWAFVMPLGEGQVEIGHEHDLTEAAAAALRCDSNASGAPTILPLVLDPFKFVSSEWHPNTLIQRISDSAGLRLPVRHDHRHAFLRCLQAGLAKGFIIVMPSYAKPGAVRQFLNLLDEVAQRMVVLVSSQDAGEPLLRELLKRLRFEVRVLGDRAGDFDRR